MAQIVLFENIHPSARAVFEAAGYTDYPLAVSGSAAPEGPAMTRP